MVSDPIQLALDRATRELLDDPSSSVHTVYRGLKEVDGKTTATECIVCVVNQKRTSAQLAAESVRLVPSSIAVAGRNVPTDVVVGPLPEIARLPLDQAAAFAANDHQRCHDCPIPGGVQIAPEGAPWVGTLGSAIAFPDASGRTLYGGLTNYHVAHGGRFPVGTPMLQPGPGSPWFGRLFAFSPIRFDGSPNVLDAAIVACRRTDGPYAPDTDTVRPEIHGIGTIAPDPLPSPKLGDRVLKAGRTTGVTRGRLVGVDARSTVNYGAEGYARFVRQYVFRGDAGSFSAGGDSGSLIIHEESRRPLALLFAGGGRDTLANPIESVLAWCRGRFFRR